MDKIIAYTGSVVDGDLGPATIGVYIATKEGVEVLEIKKGIGNSTKSFAEYYGVMEALQNLREVYGEKTKAMEYEVCLSCEPVKKQLNNEYQISEPGLVPMFIEIHNMRIQSFPNLIFTLVSPDLNKVVKKLKY